MIISNPRILNVHLIHDILHNIQEKGVCTQNRGYTEKDLLLKVTLKISSFEGL